MSTREDPGVMVLVGHFLPTGPRDMTVALYQLPLLIGMGHNHQACCMSPVPLCFALPLLCSRVSAWVTSHGCPLPSPSCLQCSLCAHPLPGGLQLGR